MVWMNKNQLVEYRKENSPLVFETSLEELRRQLILFYLVLASLIQSSQLEYYRWDQWLFKFVEDLYYLG